MKPLEDNFGGRHNGNIRNQNQWASEQNPSNQHKNLGKHDFEHIADSQHANPYASHNQNVHHQMFNKDGKYYNNFRDCETPS